VTNSVKRNKIITCLSFLLCLVFSGKSQEIIPVEELIPVTDTISIETTDSLLFAPADSLTREVLQAADSLAMSLPEVPLIEQKKFKPNPTTAVIFSALVPGLGQIYNRKYWKLPILYGGLMGCAYAITWNNSNLSDYSQAYWGVLQENPLDEKELWQNFVTGIDRNDDEAMKAKAKDATFRNQLKSKRDYFRRYRDMSIFIGVGVYVLGILDAYVDAHLFDFDISPDLSMRVEPAITPGNSYTPHSYGINCSIKF